MRKVLKPMRWAPAVLALLLAALLACDWLQLQPKGTAVPTRAEPPTTVEQSPTKLTAVPTKATIVPTKATIEGPDPANPAQDPCGLPGIQFRANFSTVLGTNALTAPFTGNVTILKTAGGPNIFSFQEVSVQRKFVILLPNLNPAVYDLKSTYMSYTEKTAANDANPRLWKADIGFLQVELCKEGGIALRTVLETQPVAVPVSFLPLPARNNTAAGGLSIGIGAKIQ